MPGDLIIVATIARFVDWTEGAGVTQGTSAWVAQMQAATLARLEAVAAMQEDLAAARGTGTSRDRATTVTVGASGVLTDITFTRNAAGLTPDQLRSAVLEAAGSAQRDVAQQVAVLTRDLPNVDQVRDLVAGRVPESTRRSLADELTARRAGDERS